MKANQNCHKCIIYIITTWIPIINAHTGYMQLPERYLNYKGTPVINDNACITEIKSIVFLHALFAIANRGRRNEGDSVYDKHNMELLAILKQESKHNPELETYCSAFEDPYGDQYDWDEDPVTQHYVCWMLNAHYNQQVIVAWT